MRTGNWHIEYAAEFAHTDWFRRMAEIFDNLKGDPENVPFQFVFLPMERLFS